METGSSYQPGLVRIFKKVCSLAQKLWFYEVVVKLVVCEPDISLFAGVKCAATYIS